MTNPPDNYITAEQLAEGIFGEDWRNHPDYVRGKAWVMKTFYPEHVADDSSYNPCPKCGFRTFQTNLIVHEVGCPNMATADSRQTEGKQK